MCPSPALGGRMERAPIPYAHDARVARPQTSIISPIPPLAAATAPWKHIDESLPQAPPMSLRQPYQPLESNARGRPVLARVAIDLDGTMIHMLPPSRSQDPPRSGVAEAVIPAVRTSHGPYDIHVRIGTIPFRTRSLQLLIRVPLVKHIGIGRHIHKVVRQGRGS